MTSTCFACAGLFQARTLQANTERLACSGRPARALLRKRNTLSMSGGFDEVPTTIRTNHVELCGRVETQPIVREVGAAQSRVAAFILVVPRFTIDGKQAYDKVEVKAWNELAEKLEQNWDPKAEVAIQGKLRAENYTTKAGVFVSKLIVVANVLAFGRELQEMRNAVVKAQPQSQLMERSQSSNQMVNGSAGFAGLSPRSPAKQVIEQASNAAPWNDPDWWPANEEEFQMAMAAQSSQPGQSMNEKPSVSVKAAIIEPARQILSFNAVRKEEEDEDGDPARVERKPASSSWLTQPLSQEMRSVAVEMETMALKNAILEEDSDADTFIPRKVSDGSFAGLGLLEGEELLAKEHETSSGSDEDAGWSDGEDSDSEWLQSQPERIKKYRPLDLDETKDEGSEEDYW